MLEFRQSNPTLYQRAYRNGILAELKAFLPSSTYEVGRAYEEVVEELSHFSSVTIWAYEFPASYARARYHKWIPKLYLDAGFKKEGRIWVK